MGDNMALEVSTPKLLNQIRIKIKKRFLFGGFV